MDYLLAYEAYVAINLADRPGSVGIVVRAYLGGTMWKRKTGEYWHT